MDHQNLEVINELGNLRSESILSLVLSGHPDLRRFLHDLFSDGVHALVQQVFGPRYFWALIPNLSEFLIEAVESLHPSRLAGGVPTLYRVNQWQRRGFVPKVGDRPQQDRKPIAVDTPGGVVRPLSSQEFLPASP
ncbi:MAG: hypothetical protein RL247_817 [Actinomycetota bacterium]